jgi:hypothetical protein
MKEECMAKQRTDSKPELKRKNFEKKLRWVPVELCKLKD